MDTSIIEYYRKINNTYNSTQSQSIINSSKNFILSGFSGCGKYEMCKINNIDRELLIYGSSNNITINTKMSFICKPNETISVGNIVLWKNLNWIVTKIDSDTSVFYQGEIQECNNTLKFYNKNSISSQPQYHEIPCIFGNGSISENDNKFITLADGTYLITIPSGYIDKSDREMRFILNGGAYKMDGSVDNSVNGLVKIKVKDDEFTDNDNKILGIADWVQNQHSYELKLISTPIVNLNYNGEISQVKLEAYDNGVLVLNPMITYLNDNFNVITLSPTGLITCISTGVANITASWQNININIVVNGSVSTQHNYTANISGLDSISVGTQKQYTSSFMDNGILITQTSNWGLYSDNETDSTDLAQILSISGTNNENCIIKANSFGKFGYVKLKCWSSETGSIYTKRIHIKSLV